MFDPNFYFSNDWLSYPSSKVGRYLKLSCVKVTCDYCNCSLILSMIAKTGTSDPCFETIWLKTKCYSIFQL